MKLLLDECVTRYLKRDLAGHEVHTVAEAGLKGFKNGALLRTATGIYDVLVTVDRQLPYQQNISTLGIAIIVLLGGGNTYLHLRPLVPKTLEALELIQPGQVITVTSSGLT